MSTAHGPATARFARLRMPAPIQDRHSWLWFGLAFAIGLLSTGRWTVALAAWIAPVFWLRFMRTQRARVGYPASALAGMVTLAITWRGLMPFEGAMLIGTIVVAGLVGTLPLLVDRWLALRRPGFATTLIYPAAATLGEWASTAGNPSGSFGATAYSQHGNLVLLQALSLAGLSAVTFLVLWLAPVVSWCWERDFAWPRIRRGLAVYGAVMGLVLLYGGLRLLQAPPEAGTVRAAAIEEVDVRTAFGRLMPLAGEDRAAFRAGTAEMHEAYFAGTRREADAGARLVQWPEGAALVAGEDEAALRAAAAALASETDVYLALPLFVLFPESEGRPPENRLVLYTPEGEEAFDHVKFGGNVFEGSLEGDRVLRSADTPIGRISGVICWDMDFPDVISQAGREGVDILLAPSNDWPAINPLHGQMASFRAIENGLSLVRAASNGLTLAVDPYGRPLASVDPLASDDRTLIAQVPTSGVPTLYGRVGEAFVGLDALLLLGLAIWCLAAPPAASAAAEG